jgi:hypothetical protein
MLKVKRHNYGINNISLSVPSWFVIDQILFTFDLQYTQLFLYKFLDVKVKQSRYTPWRRLGGE